MTSSLTRYTSWKPDLACGPSQQMWTNVAKSPHLDLTVSSSRSPHLARRDDLTVSERREVSLPKTPSPANPKAHRT